MPVYKLVFVIPYTYWGGGLQMNRLTLIQELVKDKRFEITVVVLEFSGKTTLELEKLGVKVICLNSKAKFYNLITTIKLFFALKRIKPDIVHTGNLDGDIHGFLATRLLSKVKLVVEEIGSSVDRSKLMRVFHRFVYDRADSVLCVSPDVLNDMKVLEGLRRNDVKITYNPVNIGHLKSSDDNVQRLKRTLGIGADDLVYGIISRLETFKGHKYLIEAFAKILTNSPSARLVVVGDGPLMKDLLKQVQSLSIDNSVSFVGMVENVGDYLRLFDVFVHPSTKEPFGIAIIEAMYMTKAVVSTDVGGPKDYITHNKSGLLVTPKNVLELYEAMNTLRIDASIRVKLAERAHKVVQSRFLPESYCDVISNEYFSLVTAN